MIYKSEQQRKRKGREKVEAQEGRQTPAVHMKMIDYLVQMNMYCRW